MKPPTNLLYTTYDHCICHRVQRKLHNTTGAGCEHTFSFSMCKQIKSNAVALVNLFRLCACLGSGQARLAHLVVYRFARHKPKFVICFYHASHRRSVQRIHRIENEFHFRHIRVSSPQTVVIYFCSEAFCRHIPYNT